MSSSTQSFTVRVAEISDNRARALADALVIVRQGQNTMAMATTDGFGEAHFTLPHGNYSIEVRAPNFQTASMDITVPTSDSPTTVTLQRSTQTITIQAILLFGFRPLANASVNIYRGTETIVASGTTDQEGKVSFTLEHGHTYYVTVSHQEGFAAEAFSIPYPDNVFTVYVPDFLILSIQDERDRRPLNNVHVIVDGPNNQRAERRTEYGMAWVRLWGHGQYKATVRHEGWKRVVRVYDYKLPETNDITDTILLSPTSLSIVVRDPGGKPVQGALVKLINKEGKVIREGTTS